MNKPVSKDPLLDLCKRFKYKTEASDSWTVMSNKTGPLVGDCDDFALTALWLLCGQSWLRVFWSVLTLQAIMWNVRTMSGTPHIVLWVKGRGWICNIYPKFGEFRHRKRFPYLLPIFAVALLLKYKAYK